MAELSVLRRGLMYHLQNDLVMVDKEPETIAALVALCNKLDTKYHALPSNSRSHDLHSQVPKYTPQATPVSTIESSTISSGTVLEPMDLSTNRRHLSPEERACRLAGGCCYHCSRIGHMSQACPLGQQQKPMRVAEAIVVSAQPEAL